MSHAQPSFLHELEVNEESDINQKFDKSSEPNEWPSGLFGPRKAVVVRVESCTTLEDVCVVATAQTREGHAEDYHQHPKQNVVRVCGEVSRLGDLPLEKEVRIGCVD